MALPIAAATLFVDGPGRLALRDLAKFSRAVSLLRAEIHPGHYPAETRRLIPARCGSRQRSSTITQLRGYALGPSTAIDHHYFSLVIRFRGHLGDGRQVTADMRQARATTSGRRPVHHLGIRRQGIPADGEYRARY
jgi:hypothetical protein